MLALDSAPGTCRLNLCSTLWARVCVCTDYEAIFDAKLFATMPGMYGSISNGATGAGVEIGALVFYLPPPNCWGRIHQRLSMRLSFCAFLALCCSIRASTIRVFGARLLLRRCNMVPRGDGRSLRGLPLSRPVAAPCAAVRAGKDVQRIGRAARKSWTQAHRFRPCLNPMLPWTSPCSAMKHCLHAPWHPWCPVKILVKYQ